MISFEIEYHNVQKNLKLRIRLDVRKKCNLKRKLSKILYKDIGRQCRNLLLN